jgi:ppGpp synthetase/RelA/SpoT-type nucleotidyltranferase
MSDDRFKLEFYAAYQEQRPHLDRLLMQITAFLEEMRKSVIGDPIYRIHSVRGRVKEPASLWRKCREKLFPVKPGLASGHEVFEAAVQRFSDIVGVRIVCNTLEGKLNAREKLLAYGPSSKNALFDTLRSDDHHYPDSGYRSVHFDAQLKPSAWPAFAVNNDELDGRVTLEIQVRTLLEEAWGEIQHDLSYRHESHTGLDLRPTFVALSHRLHEADLNVQRLVRLINRSTRRPRPSVSKSIPTDAYKIPEIELVLSSDLANHLKAVEDRRDAGKHEDALSLHASFAAAHPSLPVQVVAVLRGEEALDQLKLAEAMLARNENSDAALAAAKASYDEALRVLPDHAIMLWRRARVLGLMNDRVASIADLRRALDCSVDSTMPAYHGERFYRACLHRSLTTQLWHAAQGSEAPVRVRLEDEAWDHAVLAAGLQKESFRGESYSEAGQEPRVASEACMLHLCDALNHLAWLYLAHPRRRDVAAAAREIDYLQKSVSMQWLWEQDVSILDTMLRLEVEQLVEQPPGGGEIGKLVKADALRTQILQVLDQQDDYVMKDDLHSMFELFERLDQIWKGYFLGDAPSR